VIVNEISASISAEGKMTRDKIRNGVPGGALSLYGSTDVLTMTAFSIS
jgi:hypothetical protein